MPIYLYRCPDGHETEDVSTIARRRASLACDCGKVATRVLTAPRVHTVETHFGARNTSCGEHYAEDLMDPKTGKVPVITSLAQHKRVMEERGVFEKPPSKDALAGLKHAKNKSFTRRANG